MTTASAGGAKFLDAVEEAGPHGGMSSDAAVRLARLVLGFEDIAAQIRSGAGSAGLGVSEVRLMLGLAGGETGARALARRLGLDEGHVSRIVHRLCGAGLLTRGKRRGDGRAAVLALTEAGRARLARALDGAGGATGQMLRDVSPDAAGALVAGLQGVVFAADEGPEIEIAGLQPGDGGWVIERHATLYSRDEGFDSRFEAAVARIVAEFLARGDSMHERCFIARRSGRRLGCAFCVAAEDRPGVAQLRLFLVEPAARGQGLGRRLLTACREFAAEAGYKRMILHTHAEHRAACALYAATGFTLDQRFPVAAYGRRLEEQVWSIRLSPPLPRGRRRDKPRPVPP